MNVSGKSAPLNGDPYVNALLDALVDITKIDPSWMTPDHVLGRDLEMNESAIATLAENLANRFAPGGRFDYSKWSDSSLRQIVDLIRNVHGSSWRSAA